MSFPSLSVAKRKTEFNFPLQLIRFLCTLLPTTLQTLPSSTIYIILTVRVVHCMPICPR